MKFLTLHDERAFVALHQQIEEIDPRYTATYEVNHSQFWSMVRDPDGTGVLTQLISSSSDKERTDLEIKTYIKKLAFLVDQIEQNKGKTMLIQIHDTKIPLNEQLRSKRNRRLATRLVVASVLASLLVITVLLAWS